MSGSEEARPEVVGPDAPPAPPVALQVIPEGRLEKLEAYAGLLASEGTVRGLIGPREVPRLWDRHLLNCAVLEAMLPRDATLADIGSGAGLPGLVLAICRPDLEITLIEPLLRRTTFLSEVVEGLELDNVEVFRGKADLLHGKRQFDVVTSRAVAPLPRLLEWSMPLVGPHGALIAMKGSSVIEEIAEADDVLKKLGCADPTWEELGEGLLEVPTMGLRVAWANPDRVTLPKVTSDEKPAEKAARERKKKAAKAKRAKEFGAPRRGASERKAR